MKITAQILKDNREKQGLSLSEVAEATKISARVIEQIEAGELDQLPALTFLRGFLRSYAKHLKLDDEQLIQTFNEEIGEPQPKSQILTEEAQEREEERLRMRGLFTSRTVAAIGIIFLIVIIIFVKKTVEKYERERQLFPTDEIVSVDLSKDTKAPAAQIELSPREQKELTVPDRPGPILDQAKVSPEVAPESNPIKEKQVVVIKEPENKAPTISNVVVKKEAEPAKVEVKPEPIKVKPVEVAKVADVKVEVPEEKEPVQNSPQEIIIEALDKTQVTYMIDDNPGKTISLGPEQIQILKANKKLKIELKDGGAVNIIHNGRDKGVPGDLGRSMTLNYP